MKVKSVLSGWLLREGLRLDGSPYLSGALEAKILLEKLPINMRLGGLVQDGAICIYHAGREARIWVEDRKHGVPFLSSSDILRADLSHLPLISREQVRRTPKLVIHEGWTLITRSGTIGRMAYTRYDMDGMACSEHVMRVAPDPEKIPPGYLFAYLSSKFGVPLVVSGSHGAMIQRIDPHHVADVPVPRLGDGLEQQAHKLVEKAARLRVDAATGLSTAIDLTLHMWGVDDLSTRRGVHPDIQSIRFSHIVKALRLDASHFDRVAQRADCTLSRISSHIDVVSLGRVVQDVSETPRLRRRAVDDPINGAPFLSLSHLARFDPRSDMLISKSQLQRVRVSAGWLILPKFDQPHGAFGKVWYIPRQLDGVGVGGNNIRINPSNEGCGAYLWAALSTGICYQQIRRRRAYSMSRPYLDAHRVAELPVPWPQERDRLRVAALVIEAMSNRSTATAIEDEARSLVERAIAEAA